MRRTRTARHCIAPANREMASVAGLSQVLMAIDLLASLRMTSVSVSIASGEHDSELIALSEEAAEQAGVRLDCQMRGRALVLRFSKDAAE